MLKATLQQEGEQSKTDAQIASSTAAVCFDILFRYRTITNEQRACVTATQLSTGSAFAWLPGGLQFNTTGAVWRSQSISIKPNSTKKVSAYTQHTRTFPVAVSLQLSFPWRLYRRVLRLRKSTKTFKTIESKRKTIAGQPTQANNAPIQPSVQNFAGHSKLFQVYFKAVILNVVYLEFLVVHREFHES